METSLVVECCFLLTSDRRTGSERPSLRVPGCLPWITAELKRGKGFLTGVGAEADGFGAQARLRAQGL